MQLPITFSTELNHFVEGGGLGRVGLLFVVGFSGFLEGFWWRFFWLVDWLVFLSLRWAHGYLHFCRAKSPSDEFCNSKATRNSLKLTTVTD